MRPSDAALVVATLPSATLCVTRSGRTRRPSAAWKVGGWPVGLSVIALSLVTALVATPSFAASNKVRIGNVSDVSFGTIANLGVDAVAAQSICLYSDTATNGYNITASGTGPAGAFALTSGTASLPYDVQWSSSAAQSTGTQLTANVPLTGQVSSATQQSCTNGPASSASLIVVLRSAALSSAAAGTYSGTLTLLVGPE